MKSKAEIATFAGRQLANPARAPPAAAASFLVAVRTPGVLPLPAVVVEVLHGLDVAVTERVVVISLLSIVHQPLCLGGLACSACHARRAGGLRFAICGLWEVIK